MVDDVEALVVAHGHGMVKNVEKSVVELVEKRSLPGFRLETPPPLTIHGGGGLDVWDRAKRFRFPRPDGERVRVKGAVSEASLHADYMRRHPSPSHC
jgi:hypothetical protein